LSANCNFVLAGRIMGDCQMPCSIEIRRRKFRLRICSCLRKQNLPPHVLDRGGMLGRPGLLTVTGDGVESSPTLRGVCWPDSATYPAR
jgi:hypothetical protein